MFGTQYLTYTEYKDLGGGLAETPFNLLEFEIRKKIDYQTFDRLKSLITQDNAVKLCIFRLIEMAKLIDNPLVAGETTDGYNIQFFKNEEQQYIMTNTIDEYLNGIVTEDGIPVLYRGI